MGTASAIRVQVEATLAQRVPAALTLKIKQAPELFTTGMAEVDAMLGGGIPRSSITEVSGRTSTGKTSFALSTLANVTQLGNACAWVDVNDALSPESAAAAGVDLRRLLWLRMSAERKLKLTDKPWSRLDQALRAIDLLLQTGGFAAIVLDMSDVLPRHSMRITAGDISDARRRYLGIEGFLCLTMEPGEFFIIAFFVEAQSGTFSLKVVVAPLHRYF